MLCIGEMLFPIQTHQYKRRPSLFSIDFATMLHELAKPEAFQNTVLGDNYQLHSSKLEGQITVKQTHASAVLLAGERAYKLKKPMNLGFLDYSTPMLRRNFCIQESLLNRRLAPQVYL